MITANLLLFCIDFYLILCYAYADIFFFFSSTPMACTLMENLGLLKEKLKINRCSRKESKEK